MHITEGIIYRTKQRSLQVRVKSISKTSDVKVRRGKRGVTLIRLMRVRTQKEVFLNFPLFSSLSISLPTHILFLFPFSLFLSFPCVYRTTAIHLTLTAPQATPNSQLRPNFCLSKGLKRSQPRDLGGKTRTN